MPTRTTTHRESQDCMGFYMQVRSPDSWLLSWELNSHSLYPTTSFPSSTYRDKEVNAERKPGDSYLKRVDSLALATRSSTERLPSSSSTSTSLTGHRSSSAWRGATLVLIGSSPPTKQSGQPERCFGWFPQLLMNLGQLSLKAPRKHLCGIWRSRISISKAFMRSRTDRAGASKASCFPGEILSIYIIIVKLLAHSCLLWKWYS